MDNNILPFAPKLLAHAVNQVAVKTGFDAAAMFRSMERQHGVIVQASHTGIEIYRKGSEEVLYKDGTYTPSVARGRAQCADYRLRMLKMFRWALKNLATAELEQNRGWIDGQFK